MTVKEFWDELNKTYGTDLEMPAGIDGDAEISEDEDMSDIEFDMAMGMSFDAAMQKNME